MGIDAWALVVAFLSVALAAYSIRYSRDQAEMAKESAAAAVRSADAAKMQASAALQQVELSEQARREQRAPFVVVDIRPAAHALPIFLLVIENIGPTVARNVTIRSEPPIQRSVEPEPGQHALRDSFIFTEGLPFMPPGQRIELFFDSSFQLLAEDADYPLEYTFTVDARGPDGDVERMVYPVDLRIYSDVNYLQVKTVHDGVKSLDKLRKSLDDLRKSFEKRLPKPSAPR